MIKGFLRTVSVFLLLVISVLSFSVCAFAESQALRLKCPDTANTGTHIEVSVEAGSSGLFGVSGVLSYDSLCLDYESVATDIANWSVDCDDTAGQIHFAASDEFAANPSESGKSILTFSFNVKNYGSNGENTVTVSSAAVSDGTSVKNVSDFGCSVKQPKNSSGGNNNNNNNNTVITDDGEVITEWVLEDKDNNYLAKLEIENVDYKPDFDPKVKKYEATVPFETERVKVTAVPQAETSTVTVENTELTYIGRNIVKVIVLSESGLKQTYRVYIERQEPTKKTDRKNVSDGGLPIWAIIAVIVGAAVILAAAIIVIIIICKKRHKR